MTENPKLRASHPSVVFLTSPHPECRESFANPPASLSAMFQLEPLRQKFPYQVTPLSPSLHCAPNSARRVGEEVTVSASRGLPRPCLPGGGVQQEFRSQPSGCLGWGWGGACKVRGHQDPGAPGLLVAPRARHQLHPPSTYFALILRSCRSRSWPQTWGAAPGPPGSLYMVQRLCSCISPPCTPPQPCLSAPNSARRGRMYSPRHFRCLEGAGPVSPESPAGFPCCALPGTRGGTWAPRSESPDPITLPQALWGLCGHPALLHLALLGTLILSQIPGE